MDATEAEITPIDDEMFQDDGPRDANGNCLGQIYLFSGRRLRCRPPGLTVGFGKSCCKNEGNTISDSVGSISLFSTAVGGVKAAYQMSQISTITKDLLSRNYGLSGTSVAVINGTDIVEAGSTQVLATASSNEAANAIVKGTNAGSLAQGLGNYLTNVAGPQLAGMFVTWATGSQEAGTAASTGVSILLGANPITAIAMGVFQIAVNLFGSKCDQQDLKTAMFDSSKYCYYVGKYCEKKYPIIGCVQRAKGYCCFNSKLGRIIHEQGRSQLQTFGAGGGWGSARRPNCRGFTPEEFQMLDFAKIDMSEYFGDIQNKMADQALIEQKATQKIQEFYQNIR